MLTAIYGWYKIKHSIAGTEDKKVKVLIGKPIPWQTFNSTLSHQEWANKVREHVYLMAKSGDHNLQFT